MISSFFLIIFRRSVLIFLCNLLSILLFSQAQNQFPFASVPLNEKGDLSSLMVAGVDRFLMSETDRLRKTRKEKWQYDFSSPEAFQKGTRNQRILLRTSLGVVEQRLASFISIFTNAELRQMGISSGDVKIVPVRWNVLDGMAAEGLLLQPKGKVLARIVMIPDADVLPEVLAGFQNSAASGYGAAQLLAKAGCQVLIPVLINRDCTYSGSSSLNRFTNQPHREWIYRQAYELGRHVIGYELQKVFAAIDWFESQNANEGSKPLIGVAGHGEGGLLALYAAALDSRIASTLVSGYFDTRDHLWREPIYRNIFGLLKNFGDAEIAVMAWPRPVIVEHAKGPEIAGPPPSSKGRTGATPGQLTSPDISTARFEWEYARAMIPQAQNHLQWIQSISSSSAPFSRNALTAFAKELKINFSGKIAVTALSPEKNEWINLEERQARAVKEMENQVQRVLDTCARTRDRDFWSTLKGSIQSQQSIKSKHRQKLGEVIGWLPKPTIPQNPRARLLKETDKWTSYEITLDVFSPDVFAWGILIIPKDITPGDKLPTVVCQHGLEGTPADVVTDDTTTVGWKFYKSFATRLAERGYVTFVPHNPYRGEDKFRVLQRKGNPIGLSIFSVITSQHERILEWLGQQSFVDPARIGFYGLSYGGKTAMRVPALLEGYALSICSANFNEWVRKVSATGYNFSYMYSGEYDMLEWNMGHTFNYAEMAALIAPRPFMVERGHNDPVGGDEWVDFEFAKVRLHYVRLGIPEATRIEHFNGPHTINGVGTFEFLDKYLRDR